MKVEILMTGQNWAKPPALPHARIDNHTLVQIHLLAIQKLLFIVLKGLAKQEIGISDAANFLANMQRACYLLSFHPTITVVAHTVHIFTQKLELRVLHWSYNHKKGSSWSGFASIICAIQLSSSQTPITQVTRNRNPD